MKIEVRKGETTAQAYARVEREQIKAIQSKPMYLKIPSKPILPRVVGLMQK